MRTQRDQEERYHPAYIFAMKVAWWLAHNERHLDVEIGFLFCGSSQALRDKISRALDLLAAGYPRCLARLRRASRGVLVMPLGTAVGEFFSPLKLCCLDEKYVSKDSTLADEIAATLVHEATHAHLYAIGIGYPGPMHLRIEKLCHRRELWFGKRLGSQGVCERAENYLQQPDSFWSPEARKARWLNTLKEYEITGWVERFFKYLIERRFA